jgi:tripeptide aminopeptidase
MIDKRLLEIFLELVKIDGLSGEEKNVAEYIIDFLKKLNLSPYQDNINNRSTKSTGNVLCKIGDGGNFVLLSHMDTARPTKNIKVIVHDDRITSDHNTILGADNRAGIASILYSIEKLILQNKKIKDHTIALTVCEETTMEGSINLKLDPQIKMGFVFDSSYRPGNFVFTTPGLVNFKVKVIGKASHSGIAPEKGVNSIKIAGKAISMIDLGKIDMDSTANIGIINGGTAVNVVPEDTFLQGEARSMKLSRVEEIIGDIRSKFEKAASEYNGRIEFESSWDFKPYKLLPEDEVFRKICTSIKNVGLNPNPVISFGGSDANSLNEKGIPSVDIGIGAQNPHSNEEFILLEDLEKSAEIAMNLIKQD